MRYIPQNFECILGSNGMDTKNGALCYSGYQKSISRSDFHNDKLLSKADIIESTTYYSPASINITGVTSLPFVSSLLDSKVYDNRSSVTIKQPINISYTLPCGDSLLKNSAVISCIPSSSAALPSVCVPVMTAVTMASPTATNSNKTSTIATTTAASANNNNSSSSSINSSVIGEGTISAASSSPVATAASTAVPSAVSSPAPPPLLSHAVHIPCGAAVVANIAGSRTSQAVTAIGAQRSSVLTKQGINLTSTNWNRSPNSNTIMTCGSVSNTITPAITSIATTNTAIAAKFTRVATSQLPSRLTGSLSMVTSSPASINRPNAIARVAATTNTSTVASRTLQGSLTAVPRSTTSMMASNSNTSTVARTASVSSSPLTRTVFTPSRPPGSVRPPPPLTSVNINSQPIRLAQTLPSGQRQNNVTSYAFSSSVQRPVVSGAQLQQCGSGGGPRARPAAPTTRFSLPSNNLTGTSTSTAGAGVSQPRNLTVGGSSVPPTSTTSALPPPARPQSNPGLSSAVMRPVHSSASRPASTGPSTCPAPVQTGPLVPNRQLSAAGGPVRSSFNCTLPSAAPGGSFFRSEGAVRADLRASTLPTRPQSQQLLHMVNSPNLQKVPGSGTSNTAMGGNNNAGVVRGVSFNSSSSGSNSSSCLVAAAAAAPSIAVRITSSVPSAGAATGLQHNTPPSAAPQVSGGSSAISRTCPRPADHTNMGAAGVTGLSSAAAASAAAAAVLPPGTTITPAVLPLSHQGGAQDAQLNQPNVFLHRGVAGSPAVQYTINSQQQQPQHQFYVEGKPAITISAGNTGSMVLCKGSSGNSGSAGLNSTRRPVISSGGSPSTAVAATGSGGSEATSAALPQQGAVAAKLAASPRPSILRKRPDYDNVTGSGGGSKACKNLSSALSSSCSSSGSSSTPSSPKRPDSRGNSGASTGSATLSANSSPGLLIEEGDSNEDPRVVPSAPAAPPAPAAAPAPQPLLHLPEGISPRKKPRKQQLTGNELQDANHSSDEEDERASGRPAKRSRRDYHDGGAEGGVGDDELESCGSGSTASHWPESAAAQSRLSMMSPGRSKGPNHATSNTSFSPAHRNAVNHSNNNSNNRLLPPRLTFNMRNKSGTGNVLVPLPYVSPNNMNSGSAHNTSTVNSAAADGPSKTGSNSSPGKKLAVTGKKSMKLIDSCKKTWKSRSNHFVRYSDLKVKEERRSSASSISHLAGQKWALQKLEGWKVVHVSGQVTEMAEMEQEVSSRFNGLLDALERRSAAPTSLNRDVDQVCELIKANVQRSKIIHDQMSEANHQMRKLFVHKDRVAHIMTKYSSKRQLRKKDKR